MIGVIADDITGAAETGAVGFRKGLSAAVCIGCDASETVAEFIVADTDSRSCSAKESLEKVTATGRWLWQRNPEWVYKKIDSVLRGHVLSEVRALLEVSGLKRALLVPNNPSLGRVIRGGRYFIEGMLVDQTGFAYDPEFPMKSADVIEMLRAGDAANVILKKPGGALPDIGIIVGEAETGAHVQGWAKMVDENTLPVGGAEFLSAVLDRKAEASNNSGKENRAMISAPELFICGSTSPGSMEEIAEAEKRGVPVLRMPLALCESGPDEDSYLNEWGSSVAAALKDNRQVVAAIGQPVSTTPGTPARFNDYMTRLVKEVFEQVSVSHLYAEGGATASAIIHGLGWSRMNILHEWAPGVVSMKVAKPHDIIFTMKPGSYAWPNEFWSKDS